jgi:hypothetical protein
MANLQNYNRNKLDFLLSNSDYWDLFLSTDADNGIPCIADCDYVWYDFNENIFPDNDINKIASLVTWPQAVNTGYTFNTIGLTGIDNGLIVFDKTSGDTSNVNLLAALTGSSLVLTSGNTKMTMNQVTGTTGNFVYPLSLTLDSTTIGNYVSLSGGFYQGYFKIDGSSYEVLPTRYNQSWAATFWLKKQNILTSGNTLNDVNPNNKGFFFYMGTRAENKFWTIFSGASEGCASGCTVDSGCTDTVSEWCTLPKETDIVLTGDYNIGIPLSPPAVEISLITNEFLIYGRARSGATSHCGHCGGNHDGLGIYSTCTYDGEGVAVADYKKVITDKTNPFLIYGRARSGATSHCGQCGGNHDGYGTQTTCSYTGNSTTAATLDYAADIIDNAIGFRIKDDGSIGYRLLTYTGICVGDVYTSGVTVEEAYSSSGMVTDDVWTNIVIKFAADTYLDDCELLTAKPRKGKLYFYINGFLKLVVHDFNEFIARRLVEYKDKQVGVPFNFSLGGGSQGLIESQTFDGLDPSDMNLPIQTNFAGTFMGSISQFKFYGCNLTFPDIKDNYIIENPRYNPIDNNLLLTEDGFGVGMEDGFALLWE